MNTDCFANINILLCGMYFIIALVCKFFSNKITCTISDTFNMNTAIIILVHKQNINYHYNAEEVQIKK